MGEFPSVALAVPARKNRHGSLGQAVAQWRAAHGRGKVLLLIGALVITACSSTYQGKACQGKVRSLSGQPLGTTQVLIIDKFTSFTITRPEGEVDSGPLFTTDRTKYVPSAVTPEGFLAQRLSDTHFSLINAPQDKWFSYTCP